jgi:hypothetical protein
MAGDEDMAPGNKMQPKISASSIVKASRNQVSANLDGESVILSTDKERYYGLDPVGSRIWQLIHEPCLVAELRDTLLQEYEVTEEELEQDLLALLQTLAGEGLIEVSS